jgi:hypothetical protein
LNQAEVRASDQNPEDESNNGKDAARTKKHQGSEAVIRNPSAATLA